MALSILTIDAGYLFEGVGIPLGRFEFASGTLTRPAAGGIRKRARDPESGLTPSSGRSGRTASAARSWPGLPMPLPEHYLLGFDEQKIEAEGFPNRFSRANQALAAGDVELARTRGRLGR